MCIIVIKCGEIEAFCRLDHDDKPHRVHSRFEGEVHVCISVAI